MIYLTQNTRIYLAVAPADFRRQIDGLVAYCKHKLKDNPRSGALFVFINRSHTMIRILHHDGAGYWLATKRLSKGRYQGWPRSDEPITQVEAAKLMQLIKSKG